MDGDNTPPLDVVATFRNIVAELQVEPQRYKLFGVWWWPVKALLRRAGYGQDQLPMLGSYMDAEVADMVPRQSLPDTLRAALEEYQFNAAYPHPAGEVENPDGELVMIFDEDAGL